MSKSIEQKNKNKHVIVISYDAFSVDNWEAAKQLPYLAELIANGSASSQVESVYPTFTYVIHTSYVTGVYPNKHGVYHNNPLQPFVPSNEQEWFWYRRNITVPTIFEAVTDAGLNSASLLWPVSGNAKIDYNIPEIRAIKGENQAFKILKTGSPLYAARLELKYGSIRRGILQPYLDDFTTQCAVDTIKRKKPNLFTIHLIDLDDIKHEKGTVGSHIDEVLQRMDNRIGDIVQATKDAGIFDTTTFIVIGDHGQKDVHTKLHLNQLLLEQGLIYKQDGQYQWRAYIQGAGGAAYVYVKDGDHEAKEKVFKLLQDAVNSGQHGISQLIDQKQLKQLKSSTHAAFMLEAEEGYCFEDELDQPIKQELAQYGKVYATHGYLPTLRQYTSNVVIAGHQIKKHETMRTPRVVDLAPTLAKLLDVPFLKCDGRVWTEIIE